MENKTLSEDEVSLWAEEISGNYEDLMEKLDLEMDSDLSDIFGESAPVLSDEQIEAIFQSIINADSSQLNETTIEELVNI